MDVIVCARSAMVTVARRSSRSTETTSMSCRKHPHAATSPFEGTSCLDRNLSGRPAWRFMALYTTRLNATKNNPPLPPLSAPAHGPPQMWLLIGVIADHYGLWLSRLVGLTSFGLHKGVVARSRMAVIHGLHLHKYRAVGP